MSDISNHSGFRAGFRAGTRPGNRNVFYLITNRPQQAAMELLGAWPVPSWCEILSRREDLARLAEGDRVFGLFYGLRCPLEQAWDGVKFRTRFAFLSADDFDRIHSWRMKRAAPGILPGATTLDQIAARARQIEAAGGDVSGLLQARKAQ